MALQHLRQGSEGCFDSGAWRPVSRRNRRRRIFGGLTAALLLLSGNVDATHASADVTDADLNAGARALSFLDTRPHDGTIAVGVVYSTAASDGKAVAQRVADRLSDLSGPNTARFQPTLVPIETLSELPEHLDVLYVMPGLSDSAAAIIQVARQRHLLTISSDPACLETKFCVLMVRVERRVEIVLDTALADAVGAHFPSVFMILVTRK